MKAVKAPLILGCLATTMFAVVSASAQTPAQTTHSKHVPKFHRASTAPKPRMTTVHEAAAHEAAAREAAATAAHHSARAHAAVRARPAPVRRPPSVQLARPAAATLQQAAVFALGNNPELLTAAANYEATHQQAKQAFGGMLPQVGVNYGIANERSDNSSVNSEGLQWITLTRQQAQVNVDQLIFDGGTTFNRWHFFPLGFILASLDPRFRGDGG